MSWLVKFGKGVGRALKIVGKDAEVVGKAIIDSPIDDIAVSIFLPSFSPQWQAIEAKIQAVQVKWDGTEGQGAVKRAEVLAASPELLDLANKGLAWTGHKINYDTNLIGVAIDAQVAAEKAIKALLDSGQLIKLDAGQPAVIAPVVPPVATVAAKAPIS